MSTYLNFNTSFTIAKVFDLCKLKSLYSGSSVVSDSGATMESSFALTDNERDFFDITLKEAASKVYDAVSQDTQIVEQPFLYDVNGLLSYSMMVHGDWDRNQSFGVNTEMEKALVSFILREWYKTRGRMDLFQIEDANYQSAIQEVRNLLNRRIRSVTRVYRYLG